MNLFETRLVMEHLEKQDLRLEKLEQENVALRKKLTDIEKVVTIKK